MHKIQKSNSAISSWFKWWSEEWWWTEERYFEEKTELGKIEK